MKRSEASVMRSVEELLKARGLLSFRMQCGDRFGSYKGKTWRIRGNPSGTADILFFLGANPVWCECKSSIGLQSAIQKQFQEIVEREGHNYLIVRSASELEEWIKALENLRGN